MTGTAAPLNFTNTLQRDDDIKFDIEKKQKIQKMDEEFEQQNKHIQELQQRNSELDSTKKNQEAKKSEIKQ